MKTFDEEVKKLTAVPKDFGDDIREILYQYTLQVAGLSNYVIDNDTIDSIKSIIHTRLDSCPVVLVDVSMTPDKHEYAHAILNSDAYRAFGIEGKEK